MIQPEQEERERRERRAAYFMALFLFLLSFLSIMLVAQGVVTYMLPVEVSVCDHDQNGGSAKSVLDHLIVPLSVLRLLIA